MTSSRRIFKPSNVTEYLDYAKQTNLNPTSTVFRGTLYELKVKQVLESLSIQKLKHVAGSFDNGIDLKGKLDLGNFRLQDSNEIDDEIVHGNVIRPNLKNKKRNKFNILVQCKSYNCKLTAMEIRQMSGIFHINSTSTKSSILFLCSTYQLTKQGLQHFQILDIPLIYVQISPYTLQSNLVEDPYSEENYIGGQLLRFFPNDCCEPLFSGSSYLEHVLSNIKD